MLISRIATDVHDVEFAAKHATALVPKSDEGGFAEYLARAMDNPGERAFSSHSLRSQSSSDSLRYDSPADEPTRSKPVLPDSGVTGESNAYEPDPISESSVDSKPKNSDDSAAAERAGAERTAAESSGRSGADAPAKEPVNESSEAIKADAAKRAAAEADTASAAAHADGEGAAESVRKGEVAVKAGSDVETGAPWVSAKNPGATGDRAGDFPVNGAARGIENVAQAHGSEKQRMQVADRPAADNPEASLRTTVVDRSSDSVTLEVAVEAEETGEASEARSKSRETAKNADAKSAETRMVAGADEGTTGVRRTAVVAANAEPGSAGRQTDGSAARESRAARVEVADLRPAAQENSASGNDGSGTFGSNANGEGGGQNADARFADLVSGRSAATPDSAGLPENARGPALAMRAGSGALDGGDGSRLGQSLRDGLSSEIVKHARFVIRENDSGTIRLHLKPEHLGSVRIALQMQDGHIAGRIIVDNQSVREAFEQNLPALERAFEEAGMEMGDLDVALSDSETRGEQSENQSGGRTKGFARGTEALAGAVPEMNWIADDHELVDVMA